MRLVICMWANADQWKVRKSSGGFLRKKHKTRKQMVPSLSSGGYCVWMECIELLWLSSTSLRMKPAREGQGWDNHHRLVEPEPLRIGRASSIIRLLLVWDNMFPFCLVRFSSSCSQQHSNWYRVVRELFTPSGEVGWAWVELPSPHISW